MVSMYSKPSTVQVRFEIINSTAHVLNNTLRQCVAIHWAIVFLKNLLDFDQRFAFGVVPVVPAVLFGEHCSFNLRTISSMELAPLIIFRAVPVSRVFIILGSVSFAAIRCSAVAAVNSIFTASWNIDTAPRNVFRLSGHPSQIFTNDVPSFT